MGRLMALGTDPDPRFSFANERTFLAWIRTSLALIAGGIGLEAFVTTGLPVVLRQAVAALLLVCGGALAMTAFSRWLRSEQVLRQGRSLPGLGIAPVLAAAVALCAAAVLVGFLVTLR